MYTCATEYYAALICEHKQKLWSLITVYIYSVLLIIFLFFDLNNPSTCIQFTKLDYKSSKSLNQTTVRIEPIEEADCKRTTTGWEYSGKIGVTKSGRTCQAWGSQTPHEHTYGTDLPGNYCRDPSDSGYLWCYTTDPDKKWEECNVPDCGMFCNIGKLILFCN